MNVQSPSKDMIKALEMRKELKLMVKGVIIGFELEQRIFWIKLSMDLENRENAIAEMRFEEFSCQMFDLIDSLGKPTINLKKAIGMEISAVILEINDKTIRVSRKKAQEIIFQNIVAGQNVEATVLSICPYAVFCDIGSGIIAMNHISQLSKVYYRNIGNWIHIGDKFLVEILSIVDGKILISRRKYAEMIAKYVSFEKGQVFKGKIGLPIENKFSGGYVIEINPGISAIADSAESFSEGEEISVSIKRIDSDGKIRVNII